MREKKEQRLKMKKGSLCGYKHFSATEKAKLKISYPFLSASQINGKIKKKWRILCIQRNMKKTTHKFTPTKSKKRRSSRNQNKKIEKNLNIKVSDTPEFINTQKLQDFRRSHEEKYDNDFVTDHGRISSLKNNEMVNQTTSTISLEYSTKATVNDMDSCTFDVDSDDDMCSDDDAALIKRSFDINGNIVDYDCESELNVIEDNSQNNNFTNENITAVHTPSENSVIEENKAKHCPNKAVDDLTKWNTRKSCENKSSVDRCLKDLKSTGIKSSSSPIQADQATDEMSIYDMFSDVTSPDTGSKGLYKTIRMVKKTTKSDAQIMNQQFEQLFNEENDFIFLN